MSQLQLPRVVSSPTTLQYAQPSRASRVKLFFKPRFSLTKEQRAKTLDKEWLRNPDPLMPPYPYGRNIAFREANDGLYGGSTIQSGNKISKGRNKGKTVRKWFPNVRLENIRSEALGKELTIPITARCLRTINKSGGLDQYLLGDKPARIKELGLLGWKLRWHVMNSKTMKKKYATGESDRLRLKNTAVHETFETVWNDLSKRNTLLEQQRQGWEELREKSQRFEKIVKEEWNPSDETYHEIPDMSTLVLHDPTKLNLPDLARPETRK